MGLHSSSHTISLEAPIVLYHILFRCKRRFAGVSIHPSMDVISYSLSFFSFSLSLLGSRQAVVSGETCLMVGLYWYNGGSKIIAWRGDVEEQQYTYDFQSGNGGWLQKIKGKPKVQYIKQVTGINEQKKNTSVDNKLDPSETRGMRDSIYLPSKGSQARRAFIRALLVCFPGKLSGLLPPHTHQ